MWITLTADDLKQGLSGPEVSALSTAALASGQGDPLPAVVLDVIREVRGYISAHPSNVLGAGDTIPDTLKATAIARVRFEAFTRLPVKESLLTEARQKANEAALQRLRDVARGMFAIQEPTTPDPVQQTGPAVSLVRPGRASETFSPL